MRPALLLRPLGLTLQALNQGCDPRGRVRHHRSICELDALGPRQMQDCDGLVDQPLGKGTFACQNRMQAWWVQAHRRCELPLTDRQGDQVSNQNCSEGLRHPAKLRTDSVICYDSMACYPSTPIPEGDLS